MAIRRAAFDQGYLAGGQWARANPERCKAVGLVIARYLESRETGVVPDTAEVVAAIAEARKLVAPGRPGTRGEQFAQGVQQAILEMSRG